ncbi:MAG: DUF2500 family protein [Microcoleus sp. PH2017_39_LGB_O_B]|jgi:hypothetical protein|uniref:DUF2500 family protein n=1 Tax=unclassified Microcoleus TaxID=2642155 RepID=UPI001DFFEEA2|nr:MULTISPECIES: DUF2500 family protein [unclassified Microcoleus]MCC3451856.1 DUF2500 family protein [Microcoleus sp. PH2017_09_SFU_O_A]MCC3632771.1 DUF2500 family protein [Microcoleus sp. PH2017_39_LGB_O_B]MCC3645009.1 DUF2500 family protein [Microcoleus sp. PH2017_33_LGB_O_A]TAF92929.1 MAG: DUF2500 family protein [Oscillatoriales cyanobacterium]
MEFFIVFLPVIALLLLIVWSVKWFGAWSAKVKASLPSISREARVVTKRQHHLPGLSFGTMYYVTFEFSDRSRAEIVLYAHDYAMLAQDDRGTLFYSIWPGSAPGKLDSMTTLFKRFDRDLT